MARAAMPSPSARRALSTRAEGRLACKRFRSLRRGSEVARLAQPLLLLGGEELAAAAGLEVLHVVEVGAVGDRRAVGQVRQEAPRELAGLRLHRLLQRTGVDAPDARRVGGGVVEGLDGE